jgi:AraC-like DNA-binding protein
MASQVRLPSGPAPFGTQRVGAFSGVPALIRQFGADSASTLARAGLAADALNDPENRITYAALGRLLRYAAEQTRCAHFGLLAGRMWRLADLGLVGELTRHSPTVGDALRTLVVYQHLNSGGGLAFSMQRGGMVDLGYAIYQPGVAGAEQIYDAVLAAAFNYMRELCGPAWLPTDVLIAHTKPIERSPYRRLLKVAPRFNSEFSALRFSEHWMERRIDGADAAIRRAAMQRAEHTAGIDLVDQVFRSLRVLLLHGKTSGDDLAQMLSMHRRTLNRRLKGHGTTFQHVLDQVRFAVACQLLGQSDISLDDVAATLGYAGVSPFMRTFRRWTGTTPGRWRLATTSGRALQHALHWHSNRQWGDTGKLAPRDAA